MCVNGWESEYPFSVNSYESEYPKNDESGNIYESGKISSSVNLALVVKVVYIQFGGVSSLHFYFDLRCEHFKMRRLSLSMRFSCKFL